MRVLVAGAEGLVGREVVARLGQKAIGRGRGALDITCPASVERALDETGARVVINAAAMTHVDACEVSPREAFLVNAEGPRILADALARRGGALIHLSTDYVFDGSQAEPYGEDAPLNPVSAYGRTKAEGERRARTAHPDGTIVLRTAWLYGEHGPSFVRTMMRLYREGGTLAVVDDQHGQPTWTRDLADQTIRMLDSGLRSATLHGTNAGATSWHGFAQAIVENLGGDPADVTPVTSADYPRRAPRPANSVLSHDGWRQHGLTPMRAWRPALDSAMTAAGWTP